MARPLFGWEASSSETGNKTVGSRQFAVGKKYKEKYE